MLVVLGGLRPYPAARGHLCLCLPHDWSETGLGHGTEDRIGSKAQDRSVERKVVAAQDAMQNLPTRLVVLRDGLLKELHKRIPHVGTVRAEGAFCEDVFKESLFSMRIVNE